MLTIEEAATWHMRETSHHNGGTKFFGYTHTCIEQPRLSRFDRYDRKTKEVTSTWHVDGEPKDGFEQAIDALNRPPVFTGDEIAELRKVGDDFQRLRGVIDALVAHRLSEKGAVEFRKGECRLTDVGRAALAEKGNT
ncbi:hypothetical protein [Herbaspirillum huttiense]|uniref:hypothetical protein n=1 Tax=Herbaspirillum huttiense TaxID=863372 RepID=UPI0031D5AD74